MTTIAVISNDSSLNPLIDQPPVDTTAVRESAITSDMPAADRSAWLASLAVDVIVFGPDIEPEVALESSSFLRTARPEVDCLVVREADNDFLAAAMHSGIRDVVTPSDDQVELWEAVRLLSEAAVIRSSLHVEARPELGTVVTVFGPKGGVGKTTIAVNLAYALSSAQAGDLVIVDLDLSGGDIADSLGIEPSSNVATVVGSRVVEDPTSLKLSLTAHPSGALVLPAPTSLAEAATIDADNLSHLFNQLARLFRIVLVDTGPGSADATVAAVRAADDLVVVTTPELGGVRTLERHLDGYDAVGFQKSRRHVVLNKEDRRSSLTREDIESVLRRRIDHALPYDRNVPAAANDGSAYLEIRPRGAMSNGITGLAAALRGGGLVPARQPAEKGWFR